MYAQVCRLHYSLQTLMIVSVVEVCSYTWSVWTPIRFWYIVFVLEIKAKLNRYVIKGIVSLERYTYNL